MTIKGWTDYECEGIYFYGQEWEKFKMIFEAGVDFSDFFSVEYSKDTEKKLRRIAPKIYQDYTAMDYPDGWYPRELKREFLQAEHQKYVEDGIKSEKWQIAEIKLELIRGWKRMVEITGRVEHRKCKVIQKDSDYLLMDDQDNRSSYEQLGDACYAMAQRIEEIIDQEKADYLKADFEKRFPLLEDEEEQGCG